MEYKVYSLAEQWEYCDRVFENFEYENLGLKTYLRAKTVFHQFSYMREFICNLQFFCNAICSQLAKENNSPIKVNENII